MSEGILVSILSRLKLREAALTCFLSKRWRYLWICISFLNFDVVGNIGWDLLPRWWSKYINWVSRVLAQHRGLNIDEFRVVFYLTKTSSFPIDGWVEFALSNRVNAIEHNLLNFNRWRSPLEHYKFPYRLLGLSALGSCLKNSCNMNPCMFVGFKILKTLSLKVVGVGDEAVEYFLFNCLIFER